MCKKKNDIFQSLPLLEKRHLVEEFNFRCYNTRSEMENGIGFTSGFKNNGSEKLLFKGFHFCFIYT
jgi:hypothetical protein